MARTRCRIACAVFRFGSGFGILAVSVPYSFAHPNMPVKTGVNQSSRPPQGPSFNCTNARILVERTICTDRDLSLQDRQIAALYRQLLRMPKQNPNQTGFFQTEQRDYLANRNRCDRRPAVIKDCLVDAHENRIARLQELIDEVGS
jgi:uncharacterized protein